MSEAIAESAPSSQGGSFYSASSFVVDGDNKNQRDRKFKGGGNSLNAGPIQDRASIGMTLPSPLIDRLEQDSPVMGDLEMQSQILPDSQGDIFDGISNSAVAKGLFSKSNESLKQVSQLLSPKLERLSGIGDGLQGNLHIHSGNVARSVSGLVGSQSVVDGRASDSAIAPVAGALEPRRTSASQDSDAENLRLEHWEVFSPISEGQDANMGNRQWKDDDGRGQDQNPIEVNSDDDFGNIRFSQLDDGFNIVPEASQKSRESQTIVKVEKPDDRVDETAWLSTSAAMLGDIGMRHKPTDFFDTERDQPGPLFVGGGFSSASGKKLAPLSRAALARVANLFDNDDDPGFGSSADRNPHIIDMSAQAVAPKVFGGFSTAGKKALPPISKAARDRAALLFEDEDIDTAALASRPPESLASITASAVRAVAAEEFGGFTSGSGKKLVPVSKDALDKWSKQFSENDASDSAARGVTEPSVRQDPFPQSVPPISTVQPHGFAGFSSGTGKTLAPISKAAQERALSVLEMNHKSSLKPALGSSNRLSLSGASGFRPLIATGGIVHQQPVLSSHMNNLKRKSLRSSSTHSSLPGIMKPLSKASAPFKPPLPFKSPLKIPSSTATPSGTGSEVINVISDRKTEAANVLSAKHAISLKKPTNRRTMLHPNARSAPTEVPNLPSAQPTKVALTPYKSLFSLEAEGTRESLRKILGQLHQSSPKDLLDRGVPEDAIKMTLAKARVYRFNDWGVEEAYEDLITRGAKPDLMPKVWLLNHYGLIVWKLASYVRTWPQHFHLESMSWFSPTKILDQLSYRYEREINRAERPALRKIVEGDETAARHMVLCIASLTNEYSEEAKQDVWKVTVTDGWYILPASLDPCLTRAVERGKLKIGSKIHVCKAKLSGAENGVAILELADAGATTSSVAIALQSNGTKLARWDTKLGFQRTPMIWTTRLRNIYPDGGLVPGLDVIVLRKYPVVYLETLEDGVTKIKRNVKDEERAAEAHREQMQKRYQDMMQEVEKEFGVEANPVRVQEEIQARASELQSEVLTRNVVPFFTIRVGNYLGGTSSDDRDNGGQHHEALVTFWHAGHEPYQEGHRVRLTSLIAKKSSREFGFEDLLQLTGTRMTMVREMLTDPESMLLTDYQPREITTCADVEHLYQGAEIDLAVIILAVGEAVTSSNRIYFVVTDASKQLLLVEHQVSVSGTSSTADQNLSPPSFLKVHAGILMTNARFKIRDYKLGLDIVSSLQSYTHITAASTPIITSTHSSASSGTGVLGPGVAAGWPAYAHSSLHKLSELSLDRTGSNKSDRAKGEEDSLLDLMAKANTVLARMQPSL
ncbi:Breast cancer 2, early onset [Dissophora ornata]|nr:Breast cancer 2, early onset [Dissophora ornata]